MVSEGPPGRDADVATEPHSEGPPRDPDVAAEPLPEPDSSPELAADRRDEHDTAIREDWEALSSGLRERGAARGRERREREPADRDGRGGEGREGEPWDYLYEEDDAEPVPCLQRKWVLYLLTVGLTVLIGGAFQAWLYYHPRAVDFTVDLVRPTKFKIDVTDFFAPRVSSALQVVISVRNSNLLRSMLLESCKLVAIDATTGLKLGTGNQGPLVVRERSITSTTVSLPSLGGSLSGEDQRHLASTVLAKKVLLVTVLATCSSRLPTNFRGGGAKRAAAAAAEADESGAMVVSSNSTQRVDLAGMVKEPFFQRAPPPPEEEAAPGVHDVPV